MSDLRVRLGVDGFDDYQSKMLAAKQLAENTRAAANGPQTAVKFSNFQVPTGPSDIPQQTRKVAAEVIAINNQTAANKRAQDIALAASAKALADAQIREANRAANNIAPQIRAQREEQERLNRSAAALNIIRGGSSGGGSTPLTGEQKYARINLARQGGDVFTQAASGQGFGLIAVQQGPQIIEAMAQSGIKLSASLATMGPLIGAGAIAALGAYQITNDIKVAAEQRLAIEEKVQGAINKQILVSKEYFDVLKKGRQEVIDKKKIDDFTTGLSSNLPDLEKRRATYELLLSGAAGRASQDPDAKNLADQYLKQVQLIDEQINKVKELESEKTKSANLSRFDAQAFEREQQARIEAEKRFVESVEKGRAKVKELGETWNSAFKGVFSQANAGNPFSVMLDQQRDAAEKLKKSLSGLPIELQNVAKSMQESADAGARFKLQIENGLQVLSLRDQANKFRNPYDKDGAVNLGRDLARQYFGDPVGYESDGKTPIYNSSGKNGEAIDEYIARQQDRYEKARNPDLQMDKKVDEIYSKIYGNLYKFDHFLKPGEFKERERIADEAFAKATSGFDPLKLNQRNRELIANSLDASASNAENVESEAIARDKEKTGYLKNISEYIDKLQGTAEEAGLAAVIEVVNASNGSLDANVQKRATRGKPADTARKYNQFP